MKLLKVILITVIFLQGIAVGAANRYKIVSNSNVLPSDTAKHKRYIRRTPSVALHRKWDKEELAYKKLLKTHKKSDDDCVLTDKYSVAERLKQYPFSKAARILAVSYVGVPPNEDLTIVDTVKKMHLPVKFKDSIFDAGINVRDGELNYSTIKEVKVLDSLQTDQLTYIIYNTAYRKNDQLPNPGYNCFNPREALIFFDKDENVFDYIEICFECYGAQSQSGRITIGDDCNQKFYMLRMFFINAGIKYGTIGSPTTPDVGPVEN